MKFKNSGAALVTVLVIVFIVMAIIANLTVQNYRMIKRLGNRQIQAQSMSILYSVVDFGRAGLATSGSTAAADTLQDVWAQPIPTTKLFDDLSMSGYIVDEQSKFNLNDLVSSGNVNPNTLAQFTSLLSYLNLPQSLAYNIAFYIASPQNQNSIMSQYTMSQNPSRPAGRTLTDLSEIILIKGVNQAIAQKLSQYVMVIPASFVNESAESNNVRQNSNIVSKFSNGMPINVNTAPAEVIAAKSGLQLPMAQRMVTYRNNSPFKSQQDITTFLSTNGIIQSSNQTTSANTLNLNGLDFKSSYFTIHAIVTDMDDEFNWVALVYRPNRNGPWPQLLWQHPE